MGQPYIGEIRIIAGYFAPSGWMFCDGQAMWIAENDVLFELIGTTFGGDGQETFRLPDLRSRVPMHRGIVEGHRMQGEFGGTESETLTVQQIALHNHPQVATNSSANDRSPGRNVLATTTSDMYVPAAPDLALNAAATIAPTGGSQPHDNMQPYLGVNFIISLFGIFPSQT